MSGEIDTKISLDFVPEEGGLPMTILRIGGTAYTVFGVDENISRQIKRIACDAFDTGYNEAINDVGDILTAMDNKI